MLLLFLVLLLLVVRMCGLLLRCLRLLRLLLRRLKRQLLRLTGRVQRSLDGGCKGESTGSYARLDQICIRFWFYGL
uniref:Putative secreted peptide n=1 Tax=Anopheles braziliensis TaxID=58242 RepID=A0A2M3ZV59_9DIPT